MGKMDDTGKALEKNINSNIEFDTSVLQEKNETYSSLTDTYGIDLFTDQYEEKIEKVHLKEYDAYQKIEKKLFETDLESGKDEYERIQDQLFLYTGSEVKKEENRFKTIRKVLDRYDKDISPNILRALSYAIHKDFGSDGIEEMMFWLKFFEHNFYSGSNFQELLQKQIEEELGE